MLGHKSQYLRGSDGRLPGPAPNREVKAIKGGVIDSKGGIPRLQLLLESTALTQWLEISFAQKAPRRRGNEGLRADGGLQLGYGSLLGQFDSTR